MEGANIEYKEILSEFDEYKRRTTEEILRYDRELRRVKAQLDQALGTSAISSAPVVEFQCVSTQATVSSEDASAQTVVDVESPKPPVVDKPLRQRSVSSQTIAFKECKLKSEAALKGVQTEVLKNIFNRREC